MCSAEPCGFSISRHEQFRHVQHLRRASGAGSWQGSDLLVVGRQRDCGSEVRRQTPKIEQFTTEHRVIEAEPFQFVGQHAAADRASLTEEIQVAFAQFLHQHEHADVLQ